MLAQRLFTPLATKPFIKEEWWYSFMYALQLSASIAPETGSAHPLSLHYESAFEAADASR